MVARVLDVDHDLRPPAGQHLADSAELLRLAVREHLDTDLDQGELVIHQPKLSTLALRRKARCPRRAPWLLPSPHHHERRSDMAQGRIACLLGPGFEDSEFRLPYDALKNAGYQVDIISTKAGTELKGYKGKETVKSEKGIDEVRGEDYQAILIPGGHSPDQIRKDKKIVEFVKKFDSMKRPIAAVSHGPQSLPTPPLVRGSA